MSKTDEGAEMMKLGKLCVGGFEPGNATYWEIRSYRAASGRLAYVVYRTSIAVTEMGRFNTPERAYELYWQHVPRSKPGDNLEESMSR